MKISVPGQPAGQGNLNIGDFMAAIKKINRSVSDDDLEKHKKWSEEFGST